MRVNKGHWPFSFFILMDQFHTQTCLHFKHYEILHGEIFSFGKSFQTEQWENTTLLNHLQEVLSHFPHLSGCYVEVFGQLTAYHALDNLRQLQLG